MGETHLIERYHNGSWDVIAHFTNRDAADAAFFSFSGARPDMQWRQVIVVNHNAATWNDPAVYRPTGDNAPAPAPPGA